MKRGLFLWSLFGALVAPIVAKFDPRSNERKKIDDLMGGVSSSKLPNGVNKCIGCSYDSKNQTIVFYNHNSGGDHGVYKYDLKARKISRTI